MTTISIPANGFTPAQVAEVRAQAEKGDPAAQVKLGFMYRVGEGVPVDLNAAEFWFHKAAEQGYADGRESEEALHKWIAEHERLYQAAVSGDAQAQYMFAEHNPHGMTGLKDDGPPVYWYKRSAEGGLVDAQKQLGDMYFRAYIDHVWAPDEAPEGFAGDTEAEDLAGAILWLGKAAEQGSVSAQEFIAELYGIDGPTQNPAKVRYWLERAEAGGGLLYSDTLCRLYFDGGRHGYAGNYWSSNARVNFDGAPDFDAAFKCYQRLKANTEGYELGYMYRYGLGTVRDDRRAFNAFVAAGEDVRAWHELALICAEGKVTPRDLVGADVMLRQAIESWAPNAFLKPGQLPSGRPPHHYTDGGPSPEERYRDAKVADAQEVIAMGWLKDLRRIERRMTPAQKRRATAMLANGGRPVLAALPSETVLPQIVKAEPAAVPFGPALPSGYSVRDVCVATTPNGCAR